MNTVYAYTDVSSLEDEDVFAKYYNMVPLMRREKTDRFRFDKDKRLSLGAGALLKKMLLEAGVDENSTDKIEYNSKGKPFLPDYPDIHFNLSHSGTKALCVISDYEVGCDVETIKCADMKLAGRFFSSVENEELKKCSSKEEQDRLFYRIWTLKESFLKAVGSGLSIELASFSIILKNHGISVAQSVDRYCYLFKEFELDPDYCFSLCVRNDKENVLNNIEVRKVNLM